MKVTGLKKPTSPSQKNIVAFRVGVLFEPAQQRAAGLGHKLTVFTRVPHTNSWTARCTACRYAVTVPKPSGESPEDKAHREISEKLTCLDEIRRDTEKGRAAQRRRA